MIAKPVSAPEIAPSPTLPRRWPVWTIWDILRLLLMLVCLGITTTEFIEIRWIPLWFLSLGATEYGHWFVLAPLAVVFTPPRSWFGLGATGLAILTAILFALPVAQAWGMARPLPAELSAAFGPKEIRAEPFSFLKLWYDPSPAPITPETFVFEKKGSADLSLDLYRAQSSKPAPCVIVLHTGGWNSGGRAEFPGENSHLARNGYAVAAVDYGFAPKNIWPSQRKDVEAAMAYLKAHSAELGIDPAQFVIMGRSAGGHIAEAVAYASIDPAIRGCIAFYAPADMEFAYKYGHEDDMLKSLQLVRNLMGGNPSQQPENFHDASPIQFVRTGTPPTLLVHGRRDALVWSKQSERLNDALSRAGVPHYFLSLPWATHALDFNESGPGGQLSRYAVDYFLAAVTR